MALTKRFNTGFLVLEDSAEEIFLSVTPGFERGPGIQRDGITQPRMSDPHSVARIRNTFRLPPGPSLPPTSDAYMQRAGTWTLYHHVKRFIKERGSDWLIVGIQSNGDLTMNHWHIAYLGESHPNQAGQVCGLLTDGDPQEPIASRVYRSIVKWKDEAAQVRGRRYECLSLRVERSERRRALKIEDSDGAHQHDDWLGRVPNYDLTTKDIAPLVEFALSGKPVVEGGVELALNNTIDRFEDIRHIFNLPSVPAKGYFRDQEVSNVNLGEYQLFANLNERRAALLSPVIIDLNIGDHVRVAWGEATKSLKERHFRETHDSPSRRGEFRRYLDQTDREKVEIFFPHNVYPFGVIGVRSTQGKGDAGSVVCLSSGGLSGRVGNTLEGTARIMFDFFGCVDAMVLDEGFDVFFVANPWLEKEDRYLYDNDQIAQKLLSFTKERVDRDHDESLKTATSYAHPGGMKAWPLNEKLLAEVESDFRTRGHLQYSDVLPVEPLRSQMRSVLIFARRK